MTKAQIEARAYRTFICNVVAQMARALRIGWPQKRNSKRGSH